MWQGAAVEHRVALAPGGHQAGLGQHLEVVAHARLADGEYLRQFQHAERVVGQRAVRFRRSGSPPALHRGSQFVGRLETELGHAHIHRGGVWSVTSRQQQYQKF